MFSKEDDEKIKRLFIKGAKKLDLVYFTTRMPDTSDASVT